MISNPSFPLHAYFFLPFISIFKEVFERGSTLLHYTCHNSLQGPYFYELNGLSDARMNAVTQRQFLRAQDVKSGLPVTYSQPFPHREGTSEASHSDRTAPELLSTI